MSKKHKRNKKKSGNKTDISTVLNLITAVLQLVTALIALYVAMR